MLRSPIAVIGNAGSSLARRTKLEPPRQTEETSALLGIL
jgi:hypothetical protein